MLNFCMRFFVMHEFVICVAQILYTEEKNGVTMKKLKNKNFNIKQLDTVDQSFILLTVTIIALCLTVGILLNKCRTKWKLNGRLVCLEL